MPERPDEPPPLLSWWGWGDPAEVPELPEALLELLRGALGIGDAPPPRPALHDLVPPASRLDPNAVTRLSEIVGPEHARADDETRIRHTRGKSTPDLLAMRAGDVSAAPDLVLLPADHDQVLALLRACAELRIAVVPFGGGTSVVGGLAPPDADQFAGLVALDLRRMDALLELDEESRLAVLEPGLRGPQAEQLLGARGYTLGHFPQSYEYGSLGGFAAARSSGQASAGYGRFDELVLGLRLATPAGTLELGRAPRSAAGPDLRQLFLGSEGTLGVITALTVQIRPRPEQRVYEGWRFPDFATGAAALRRLAQDGPRATVLRLSDEAETGLNLARPSELGQGAGGALAIVGWEGPAKAIARMRTDASAGLRDHGGAPEPEAGAHWAHDRFRGPYLRDALLDHGVLVETLETVMFWSRLAGLYAAVGDALRAALTAAGTPPVVLCHISHVYPAGASLYFTVGCAAAPDPVAQWRAAKAAASDAILAAGGSITHHHGVGSDHRRWYADELGPLGAELLRAAKATLDPTGVLNPGVLIPPGDR